MLNRESTPTPDNHAVIFYDEDAELATEVAAFLVAGLTLGERAILVANGQHGVLFDQALVRSGIDPEAARSEGQLVSLDARELLASFSNDGILQPGEFEARVGGLVDAATADGSRVRIFGEMVALLWDEGNVAGAIELESLWNGLATRREFSLLCGYGLPDVIGSALEDVQSVCRLHSSLLPPHDYGSAATDHPLASFVDASQGTRVFFCLASAVPAVRRFVAGVLTDWGQDGLVPDAILVASELATNAVRHARSPFRVRLDRSRSGVRISVEDVDRMHPVLCAAAGDATSGRGVFIVDDVCQAWGSDQLTRGKVVWGDLSVGAAVAGSVSGAG